MPTNRKKKLPSEPELDLTQTRLGGLGEAWTLAQTLMWIICRSPERVREMPPRNSPFDVLSKGAQSGDGQLHSHAITARSELVEKLKAGILPSFGILQGETEHRRIEPSSWLTISTFDTPNPSNPPDAIWAVTEAAPRFLKVRCGAADVRKIWPQPRNVANLTLTDTGVREMIRAAISEKGANLTIREGDTICATKCARFGRKKFRDLLKEVQGPRDVGRPRKGK